jgi:hypothetical protein
MATDTQAQEWHDSMRRLHRAAGDIEISGGGDNLGDDSGAKHRWDGSGGFL